MPVKIKRIYDQPDASDGLRVLVDRLWPRGLTKDKAAVDLWAKEIAPTSELRRWFAHQEDRWEAFERRYSDELAVNAALDDLCARSRKETVTLLYGARDRDRNHAHVLAAVIAERLSPAPDDATEDCDDGPMEVSSPPCFLHELDPAWQGAPDNEPADRGASGGRSCRKPAGDGSG
ncbi:DUF488 domain-containing protein [Martelella soudanensis]|uniref:DUF488 domain-containing protein n=1 Tax=unclassified Martelella TaxID=2629616 RepID=UPI0015DF4D1F